ncbi:transposable element Tcb2 transposase [Trichonephila clavipes]|nr:transposable element Tcb2 transposase [Trichonephila clavipes]
MERTKDLLSNIQEIDHYDNKGLMVWAGITLDGCTQFHIYEKGSLTAVKYRNDVLEPYIAISGCSWSSIFLTGDNARSHKARMVDKFLECEDIRLMEWPIRSPDIIFIKHAWDALGRAIVTRNLYPKTIQCLKTEFLNASGINCHRNSETPLHPI